MKNTLDNLLKTKGGPLMDRLFIDGVGRVVVTFKTNSAVGTGFSRGADGAIYAVTGLRNVTAVFEKVGDSIRLVTFFPSI